VVVVVVVVGEFPRNVRPSGRDMYGIMEPQAKTTFGFQTLDVYQLVIQFVACAGDVISGLPAGQSSVADQLRRAALSIPLNIAESSGRMGRADAARHCAIARGSALESAAILDVCSALRLVESARIRDGQALLLRIVQMLSKMCR
jgi:four helix bundle protein